MPEVRPLNLLPQGLVEGESWCGQHLPHQDWLEGRKSGACARADHGDAIRVPRLREYDRANVEEHSAALAEVLQGADERDGNSNEGEVIR